MKVCASFLLLVSGILVFLTACDRKKNESDTEKIDGDSPLAVMMSAGKIAENAEKQMDVAQKVLAERREKGDTLALPYEELQHFLPESIAGYEKDGQPKGETSNGMGMSFSSAQQRYQKGAAYVHVSIIDYNQAQGAFQGLFSMAGMFSVDNTEEKMNKFDIGIPATTAVEIYKKKTRDAKITIGTGYRFWIEIEANDQPDTEFLKEVTKSMDIKKLSAL